MKKNLFKFLGFLALLVFLTLMIVKMDFFESIKISFYRTIIEEKRYILFLKGLSATLIISLFSILIGTGIGFLLCSLRRNKNKKLSSLVKHYVMFIQGVPITVLLLFSYYVIFGEINVNPLLIAIFTFSLYFSAYVSEIFKSSLDSINKTQIESAYSLGFNKYQVLKYIILPQALVVAIPTYKNECVSLIKLTSIAGYISIFELTKASDVIRNRTYEAFVPLIITAIVYFIICYILGKLLDLIYKKINPRFSKVEVK